MLDSLQNNHHTIVYVKTNKIYTVSIEEQFFVYFQLSQTIAAASLYITKASKLCIIRHFMFPSVVNKVTLLKGITIFLKSIYIHMYLFRSKPKNKLPKKTETKQENPINCSIMPPTSKAIPQILIKIYFLLKYQIYRMFANYCPSDISCYSAVF